MLLAVAVVPSNTFCYFAVITAVVRIQLLLLRGRFSTRLRFHWPQIYRFKGQLAGWAFRHSGGRARGQGETTFEGGNESSFSPQTAMRHHSQREPQARSKEGKRGRTARSSGFRGRTPRTESFYRGGGGLENTLLPLKTFRPVGRSSRQTLFRTLHKLSNQFLFRATVESTTSEREVCRSVGPWGGLPGPESSCNVDDGGGRGRAELVKRLFQWADLAAMKRTKQGAGDRDAETRNIESRIQVRSTRMSICGHFELRKKAVLSLVASSCVTPR